VTLNLGLRYDIQFPYTDPQNRKSTYEAAPIEDRAGALPGLLFPAIPASLRGIANADTNNFAPRLGLAWDVSGDGKTAVGRLCGRLTEASPATSGYGAAVQPAVRARAYTFKQPAGSVADPTAPGGIAPVPFRYRPTNPQFVAGRARTSGIAARTSGRTRTR
jgi:hypothetical protein